MNIGIVCYPTFGGSGIVATELGMELAQKGHQIHFISYSIPARLDVTLENISFHKVNIENYPLFHYQPYSLALSTLIVKIAREEGLDVLHCHYAIPHAYAAYFAKQILREDGIHLPIVTTLHGTDITLVGRHPSYQSAVEFSINQSDLVTSVSDSLRRDTLEVFKIKNPIQIIPNFIDNSLFDKSGVPCPRHKLGKKDERLVVHVSNFRKVKRIPDVISIFDGIQKVIPAKLILVGEGPELEFAEEQIRKLGIKDKVMSFGKIRDLYEILCVSDLFLLPSQQESFGLAALEAMAAGVPVVSSNAGGIPEVNIDGKTGYVCEVGDIQSMIRKSISILESDAVLEQFKKQAMEQAQRFDKRSILPLYEQIYKDCIAHVLQEKI